MKIDLVPGMSALRHALQGPEDDQGGGEAVDPAFVEQPGDREVDPEAEAVEPDAETEETTEEEATEPEVDEDEPEVAAETEEQDEEEAPKPKKDWRDRQIIKARQAAKEASERASALEAENKRLKELAEAPEGERAEGQDRITKDQARKEALAELRDEQRAKTINENCDKMFYAGEKAFPKSWQARVDAVSEVFSDELRSRPDFLEAVTDLDNAAVVYHHLAGDPDKMESILNLAPHKMGLELARISTTLAVQKSKPISKVPAPIRPLDGPSVQDRSLEDLANDPSPSAMKEFDRRMQAEEKKRWAAG